MSDIFPAASAAAPKIGFVSLGCPKALTDSELILTQLRAEGYETSTLRSQRIHHRDQGPKPGGIFQIGRVTTELPGHLRKNGTAHPVPPEPEVDQDQDGVPGPKLRRERRAHVGQGDEGADNQADRSGHLTGPVFVGPAGPGRRRGACLHRALLP